MKKSSRRVVQFVLVALLIVIGFAGNLLLMASRPPMKKREVVVAAPMARTITVHTETIPVPIQGHGTVRPLQEIQLVPQVGGKVVQISPAMVDGGAFKKEDILLTIDPADYRIAVTLAEARVKDAQSKFALAKQESSVSRSDWLQLHPGTEPPSLVAKKPQLETAKANLAAQKAELERARLNLERTRLKAPFDGRVSQKSVDIGQFVSPGKTTAVLYSIDAAEIVLPMESDKLEWFDVPGFTSERTGPVAPKIETEFATRIESISFTKQGDQTIVMLHGNGRFRNTKTFFLNSDKLVIDIDGIDSKKLSDVLEVNEGCLEKIRMAVHTQPEKKVRVVLDLLCNSAYAVRPQENILNIHVVPREKEALLTMADEKQENFPALTPAPESKAHTRAIVQADIAGQHRTWEGVVVRAEGKVDERTRMINVVVRVKAPYSQKPPLAPGLFATVKIEGWSIENGVVIPRAALRQGDVVWVVDADSRLTFRPVEVALHSYTGVVIKSGLSDNEQIVVSPIKGVTNGMAVRNVPANNGGEKS